jgi:ABC-type transport system involved in cytochrome bd biosynthesis fused ATPase/permease subunit
MPGKVFSARTWREIIAPVRQMVELDGREIFSLLVYTLALGAVSAAVPFASQILVNQAAFTGAAPPIIALAAIVFGVLLIGTFIRLFQIRVAALIGKRTFVRSAMLGTRSLLDQPSRAYEFDDREVANRFFDVMTFQVAFTVLASEALGVVVLGLVGIVLLALYHPLFLIFSILVLVVCIVVVVAFAKRGVRRSYERSTQKFRTAFWISQVAENRSLLRQTKENKLVTERSDELASDYVRSYFSYLKLLLWQSGALFLIQAISSAAFFGLGGWLVVQGQLNLGQLVAAEIVLLANLSALTRFYFYLDSFYEAVTAAWKVSELTGAGDLPDHASGEPGRVPAVDVRGITLTSDLLEQPLVLKRGDVVALRGPSRRACSVLLRDVAASDQLDGVKVAWDSDHHVERALGPGLMLYLARPAVLRMTLAENLSLLSDSATMTEARTSVLDVPLITPEEKASADQLLDDAAMSISDRARYAAARVFMSNRPVVLVDMFFNLMELDDQVEFVSEFKKRFPDRILILNAFEGVIDPLLTKIVKVREVSP